MSFFPKIIVFHYFLILQILPSVPVITFKKLCVIEQILHRIVWSQSWCDSIARFEFLLPNIIFCRLRWMYIGIIKDWTIVTCQSPYYQHRSSSTNEYWKLWYIMLLNSNTYLILDKVNEIIFFRNINKNLPLLGMIGSQLCAWFVVTSIFPFSYKPHIKNANFNVSHITFLHHYIIILGGTAYSCQKYKYCGGK